MNTQAMAEEEKSKTPRPLVIVGPSGVGKGTLIQKLMEWNKDLFGFSVSHTTRAPRPGEVNGVHYNFVTREEFVEAVKRQEFVEYANVHGNYYGTSFAGVRRVTDAGKICILDIDVQGARQVRAANMDASFVFIRPPSFEELERRLRGRGTETEDAIVTRLKNAIDELHSCSEPGLFDVVIVNDDLDRTLESLKEYILQSLSSSTQ